MNQPAAIRDHSFYYEGGDVGVLLVHGLTGTPVEMRYVGKALHKAGYTVYGVQLPGHCGNEDDLAATNWENWYDAVVAAIDALRARVSKVFVGGLSMGAVLSLLAAARVPDKVDGLLLYGPTLWYDGWSIPWYAFLWKPLIYTPIGRNYRFMEKFPYGIKDERLRKRVVHNMLSGNSADAGLAGMPSCSVRQLWKLVAAVKREMAVVTAPTLIVHALEDDISSIRNARYIAKRVRGPVDVQLLDDSYHMVTVDQQRDELVAHSRAHLERYAQLLKLPQGQGYNAGMLKSPAAPLVGKHADQAGDSRAEAKPELPEQGRWQNSLQRRMLFVYFLVGLLPMFLAAELASQVVTRAFESNLRTWLRETAIYFVSSVVDSEREASEVGGVLAQQTDLLGGLINGSSSLPPLQKSMLSAEGFDLLAIADDQGRIVYSSIPIHEQHPLYLGRNIRFTAIRTDSESQLLVSSRSSFVYKARQYQVLLGSWLDVSFFGNLSAITSFDFRLYMAPPDAAAGAGFKQIFRSGTHGQSSSQLRGDIIAALKAPDSEYFDRHVDDDAYTGIYLPLFDDLGVLKGVVFCGLRSGLSATRWVSRTNVFLIIFLTGTILSVMIGYAVSRRLTRPLRLLANSVRAITAGNYRSRVTAEGNDEVAELAHAFNGMAARLEQLQELELQLRREDRLSALGKAAAGIAHEVRNPLGVICTSTELIRSRYPLSERDQKLIDNVISEVRRIDRLIGEFLLYAKPAAVRLAPLRPSELMAHLLRVFEPELARRKIELKVHDQAGDVSIAGDADELQQAMFNVILNACDAMPDGGRLTIRLERDHSDLRISFSDTGNGVPASLGDRIFDPFVTTREQGTGLGLAKVRSVLDGHNGRVEFHNLTVGAMFEFIIPLGH